MDKQLLQKLLKLLTITPGIVGFASMDISKSSRPLKEGNYDEGISIQENKNKLDIKLGLIVNDEVPMKTIADEVFSAVKNLGIKNSLKLGKIDIYVRGIK